MRSTDGIKRSQQQLDDELASIPEKHQLDLLHSNSLSMSRLVGGFRRRTENAIVTTGHLRDIIKLSKAAVADLNHNNGLAAVSQATRDFHVAQGLNADICDVIHNGIDGNLFTAACSAADRGELFPQLSADAKILLNVGQICLRKGSEISPKASAESLNHATTCIWRSLVNAIQLSGKALNTNSPFNNVSATAADQITCTCLDTATTSLDS